MANEIAWEHMFPQSRSRSSRTTSFSSRPLWTGPEEPPEAAGCGPEAGGLINRGGRDHAPPFVFDKNFVNSE